MREFRPDEVTDEARDIALLHGTARVREATAAKRAFKLAARDIGTLLIVTCALTIAFTRLRGRRRLRVLFQIAQA